ncbi:MAG: hypothetical protein R6X34_20455 [Chloroflexota bacterium]
MMQKRRFFLWKTVLFCCLAAGVWGAAAGQALAHGGGLIYVAGESAGAYRVTVWVAPNVVEAGKQLHFTVAVVEDESNDMILDAAVNIEVWAAGSEALVLSGPATTEQSVNKLFYEADFQAPDVGMYRVVTQVNGRSGAGEVAFDLEVVEARTAVNWLLVGLGGLALVTVIGFIMSRRSAG